MPSMTILTSPKSTGLSGEAEVAAVTLEWSQLRWSQERSWLRWLQERGWLRWSQERKRLRWSQERLAEFPLPRRLGCPSSRFPRASGAVSVGSRRMEGIHGRDNAADRG